MVEKQSKFTSMIANFITTVINDGYQLTFGEAWRPPEMAQIYAKNGKGISKSLHISRLAVDLNAFFNGEYLDGSKPEHIQHLTNLGEKWESLGGSWGGRFTKKDYNHYSLADGGIQ